MGKLKKFVSRLLAGVMLLSSIPSTVYGEVNGGGDGNASGPSTYEIVGSFHNYHVNQGFRLTVVNAEGVAVSSSVDCVMYFPEDLGALLEASKSGLAVREFTEYAVEPYKNNTGNMKGKPKRYIRYLGGCKTDPIYSISGGCAVFTDGMTESQIALNKKKFNGLESIIRVDGDYTKNGTRDGNLDFTDARMYTYEMLQFLLSKDGEKNGYVNPIDGTNGTHEYIDQATGEKKVLPKKFQNPLTTYDVGGGISGFYAGGDEMHDQLMTPVEVKFKDGTSETQTIIQRILELEGFDVNGRGGKKSEKFVHLFQYIDPKLDSQVKELKEKGEKSPMSKVFKENNLRLLIESVSWRIPLVIAPIDPRPEFRGGAAMDAMHASYCTDDIIYGTATNVYHYVAEKYYEDRKEKGWYPDMPDFYTDNENWLQWFCYATGHGIGWQPAFNNDEYRLAQDAPDLGLYYYDEATQGSLYNLLKYWNRLGYAVMVTTLDGSLSGTPTWDRDTFPENNYKCGPSPKNTNDDGSFPNKYPSEGEEYKTVNKDHKFNIVKFYAEKNQDGSYIYKENHTREQAIHDIQIDDEPEYTVDNYYTSSTYTPPTNPTDDYDVWKTSKATKGTYEGTKAEKLVVKATDPDTTLYVRLVSTPKLVIVKYFPTGEKTVEEIPWVPTYDTVEPGYEYEKDKQSPNKPDTIPNDYEETNGTSENNPIINVNPSTRIIYIKYKQPEADSKITLHQNELAHTFTLEDIQALVTLTHSFSSKEHSGSGTHGSGSDTWTCSWHRVISDSSYSYIISNKEDYSLTSFIGSQGSFTPQEIGNNNDSGSLGIGGGSTNGLEPNLKFSVYRDKIKDNVTLYQGKNSDSIKNELSNIYITKEGYKPLTERIKNEGETEWYSTFKINYTYDTEDNTLSWGSSGCSTHGDSGSWDGTSNGLSEINNPFSQANNVLTKAYLGEPGIGDKESTLEKTAFNILGKTFNKNLVYEKFGDKYIQFFPYIKMKYNTVEDESNKEAYIVSTNESKVRNLSSVETGVYQTKNGFGIDITSEQWSTHRKTIDGLKENGVAQAFWNKGLLPGGATIKLSTANEDNDIPEVWVGLRTYEMSIPDDLKVTLSSTESIKTTSEAKANAEQLAEDVRNNLSNYHVEKWIKEGMTTNENDLNSGASKVSGVSYKINNTVYKPVTRFGDNDLSRDNKYYLKENVSGANSSKLDVVNIDENGKLKDMEIHIYNISSDTDGKVTVKKDGVEIVSANIKKDKNASSLLSNEEVKRVNERVKFVDNFIASLDFEEGKDRENRAWYYEAHDGIEVVEMTAAFQLGFGKDNAVRSEVADVKLTGKLENKGDILNFDSSTLNQKTRTVQYRMSAAPANVNCKKAGYIGTFNGQEIRVDNMYMVMRSRLYYMGNNTVMDLN